MQTEPFDLIKTEHRITTLIAELRQASAAVRAAGQNGASETAGTSSYPYQGRTGRYAANAPGYAGSNSSDAYQEISTLTAKIEEIKKELLELRSELSNQLTLWRNAYEQIREGQQKIRKVAGASDDLQDGRRITQRKWAQITKLINLINNELNLAQHTFPIHAQHPCRPFGRSIDEIAGHGNDLYKPGSVINYRPPIMEYVVPLLDKTRYGKIAVEPVIQYPTPRLRQDSSDRQETLWDKITRGKGHFEKQNPPIYQVELPTCYYQMVTGTYTSRSDYGIRP